MRARYAASIGAGGCRGHCSLAASTIRIPEPIVPCCGYYGNPYYRYPRPYSPYGYRVALWRAASRDSRGPYQGQPGTDQPAPGGYQAPSGAISPPAGYQAQPAGYQAARQRICGPPRPSSVRSAEWRAGATLRRRQRDARRPSDAPAGTSGHAAGRRELRCDRRRPEGLRHLAGNPHFHQRGRVPPAGSPTMFEQD